MLHFDQLGICALFGVLIPQALPNAHSLAAHIVFIKTCRRFTSQSALIKQPKQNLISLVIVVIRPHGRFGGLGDFYAQINRGFIVQLKWAQWHTHQFGGIFNQGGFNAFFHHAYAFVDVGDDAAIRIKKPCIVDNDGRFADLANIIQSLGHRPISGVFVFDDLYQTHFIDWAEKVNSDKLLRPCAGLG